MKTQFLKIYSYFLTILLTVIGFSSCTDPEPDEYGTPYADYVLKGKITSSVTEQPIKDIQTIIQLKDTFNSDANGDYSFLLRATYLDTVHIQFNDPKNVYQKTDTFVSFKDAKFTGGDGRWDKGSTTKELNIKLKPKNDGK